MDPDATLISVGDNSFRRPNDAVVERLLRLTRIDNLYRADRNGEVEFVTDDREL